ncbi:alkaline phosphatase family protein [Anaeromyxobacter diazotrophicus]|uniref:Membrane protein n=1 Tax=Anaeromyxobacter diazotrophicus TaxID=2590199 RepID=A0A7I9VIP3_9BACT|nr:alkaline phosphatase family protein [Anaeromyxobacter diazotrophicus]GEJ56235.1 membrane protein [Anaeromyxobacter diazotrophicus]
MRLRGTKARVDDALARLAGPGVRHVLRPLSERGRLRPGPLESGRRLLLVQLDGVSRRRLEWAMDAGHMPFLARRLRRGESGLASARGGVPASTPAFQAGLLYGVSPSVPGFVWYDRRSGREIRMDRASDAAAIEASLSERHRPLLEGGTSYFSIFSGGAALPHFCLSGLAGEYGLEELAGGFSGWDALASALVHTVTAARTAGRAAHELALGLWQGAAWSLTLGRLKHEPRFLLHRLLVGALMRELAVEGILIDVARGVPIVYCDLLGYDEFAHRRGPDAPEAVSQLRSMDLALAAVYAAAEAVPSLRYDVYVFSDHGHVATKPFESFTGLSLPEYLALADGGVAVPRRLGGEEAVRLAQTRAVRAALSTWPAALRVRLGRGLDRLERGVIGHALGFARLDRVVTAEAGDLAHVYFTDERAPIDLEAVRRRHPGVLSALRESRAVGIVVARQGRRGVALARGEELDLALPADVARLPHPDPALLAGYLADLVSLPHAGDLVVLGWRGEGQVPVAYAWEFGSHGGVAPEELETFFVHPPGCALRFGDTVRPDALYRLFDEAYRTPRRAPGQRGAAAARRGSAP